MTAPRHPNPENRLLCDMPGYDCDQQPAYLITLGCMDLEMEAALEFDHNRALSEVKS